MQKYEHNENPRTASHPGAIRGLFCSLKDQSVSPFPLPIMHGFSPLHAVFAKTHGAGLDLSKTIFHKILNYCQKYGMISNAL